MSVLHNMGYLLDWRNLREQCGCKGCNASILKRPLTGRKMGIRMGKDWFCSDQCFGRAVEVRIRQLQESACREISQPESRFPLGLLLLSRGCISQAQLQLAHKQQSERGGALGDILCELNFATEQEVAAAAATQWGCPVFTPKSTICEPQARVPGAWMELYSMAPVHYVAAARKLFIGFVYRVEHDVLRTIEELTSCMTAPCFITSSDCRQAIRGLAPTRNDVNFDQVSSVPEIANIVRSYAFQVGAGEARLGVCRDYVWARLNRDGCPTDLVFSNRRDNHGNRETGPGEYLRMD
ncbi:MAG: hypothetical protein WBS19_22905 [Candidatus Korobacteraceae bacterium]